MGNTSYQLVQDFSINGNKELRNYIPGFNQHMLVDTPLKINMEHSHSGLEHYFPF